MIQDFVDKAGVHQLSTRISGLRATGGGNAEDVTGALKARRGLVACSCTGMGLCAYCCALPVWALLW